MSQNSDCGRIAILAICCLSILLAGAIGCQRPSGDVARAATEPDGASPAGGVSKEVSKPPANAAAADKDAVPVQPGADTPPKDTGVPPPKVEDMLEHPFPGAAKAPSLEGGVAWINTAGPLDLKDLRGKFVLLDFWTYCCINCMHILPELKKLEAAYPNEIVVIGVHSAKFDTEEESQSITDAVLRYEIEHPVVNDANHEIWNRYRVNSWPSLRVIDPEGNLVAGDSGEVEFETLDLFFKKVMPYFKKKGLMDETPLRFDLEAYASDKTPLRFPGKVLADPEGKRLFIADSNHNRLVISSLDGKLLDVIGSGKIGAADGDFGTASFNKPQGMALKGQTLYVADTENHLLRKIDLEKKQVATIAGQGYQGRNPWPGLDMAARATGKLPDRWVGPPLKTAINSPWAVWVHGNDLYIAMAGPHQIWKMPLDESEIGPYAGNGREDIVDGPLLPKQPYEEGYSSFAQPSGLTSDGTWLYVADSEGSSIRAVPFDSEKEVKTVVGSAHLSVGRLFEFGDVDGEGELVRLQHVLGVAYANGQLYVADTYNNKIKQVDPAKQSSKTIAGNGKRGRADEPAQFYEPAGLSYAAGRLYVADTNNHLIRVIDLEHGNKVTTLTIDGLQPPAPPEPKLATGLPGGEQTELPEALVKPVDSHVKLAVKLELPDGWKINPRAPMSYRVEAKDDQGIIARASLAKPTKLAKPAEEFEIRLPATGDSGSDTLTVSLTYYYCQESSEGVCKVGSIAWTVPLKLSASAEQTSVLLEHRVR